MTHSKYPHSKHSLLNSITSPVLLLDQAGQPTEGTIQGWEEWHATKPRIMPLSCGQAVMALIVAEEDHASIRDECVQSILALNIPATVACDRGLMQIRKQVGEDSGHAIVEFIPSAGGEQLRFFKAVNKAVNSSLVLEDIFDALGSALADFIQYQEAVIVILDETQNGIKTLVRLTYDGGLDITGEYHMYAGYEPIVDHLLRNPRSLQLSRTSSVAVSSEMNDGFFALFEEPSHSILAIPLINKGIVIGLIALSSREAYQPAGEAPHPLDSGFTAADAELLEQVSSQLAVAVENARLYWQTQSQAGREFLINQLTRSIRQSLDIATILETAARELGKVMGVSRCYISYFSDSDFISHSTLFGYQLPGVPDLPAASPEDLPERDIFRMREQRGQGNHNPFILNDTRDAANTPFLSQERLEAYRIRSLAVLPIILHEGLQDGQNDVLVGMISLHQCDTYRSWLMEDIELLRAISEHLALALSQAKLFQTLDKRTRDLEHTLEELQQAQLYLIQSEKMAVLGQFVAGIAHEVNTPLGTMMGNNATLETCMAQLKPMLPVEETPEQTRLWRGIESLFELNKLAGTRIQEIVLNLRNFARLDESELKVVDLHEGIESTLLLVKSSLDPRILIVRDYAPDLPAVQCFPGLLNQVFLNLIVNAGHAIQDVLPAAISPEFSDTYTGNFTMSITIATRWDEESQTITVTVRDTGKGIAPKDLPKVFDPGFTTKGVGVGTGLGLALCYRIVEKHHGRISVESEPGHGASFTVRIPLRLAGLLDGAPVS